MVYANFWVICNVDDEGEWEYGADLEAIVILLNLLLKGTPCLFTCQQIGCIHRYTTFHQKLIGLTTRRSWSIFEWHACDDIDYADYTDYANDVRSFLRSFYFL